MIRVGSMLALGALVLAGCAKAPPPNQQADIAAITAAEDGMLAAYRARDAEKLIAAYAANGTIYAPGERPRVGTEAISAGARKDMADPAFNVVFTRAKADVSGDMGYTQGSFTIRYTSPTTKQPTSYSGYYLTVFQRQADGSWKAVQDMAQPAS